MCLFCFVLVFARLADYIINASILEIRKTRIVFTIAGFGLGSALLVLCSYVSNRNLAVVLVIFAQGVVGITQGG